MDYGIASKSSIVMTGNPTVRGYNNNAEGSILSATYSTQNAIQLTGNCLITGDAGVCNPQGRITKTGNTYARRALVEGAWAYRMRARIGRHKVDRIEALPKIIRDIGWKAQVRLCTRYRRLRARGKTANVVNVAIAREMVGFIWSIACTIQSAPKTA
jgi:hypothetical protein